MVGRLNCAADRPRSTPMPHRFDDDRTITAAGLARLLLRLDPDADRATLEYERLRRALVKFFDWRGGWPPDECADETLDRLAQKLEEAIVDDVRQYARGIARLVLLERRRQPTFSPIDRVADLVAARPAMPADGADEAERLRDCFDRCLDAFPTDGRALVIEYYEGERANKISNRRRLASARGLSDNALRSRVQRLRDRLEQCVHECVSRQK
jgi:DNA-directed RNA polymerase specialized sigma24 family protein